MPSSKRPIAARVITIEELFHLGAFVPAAVQRDYQWRSQQCQTLLTDLDRTFSASSLALPQPVDDAPGESEDSDTRIDDDLPANGTVPDTGPHLDEYMLGAMVVTVAEGGKHFVYDGLQRLTTLTVLMSVMRDLTADEELKSRLDRMIRVDHDGPAIYRVTLAGKDTTLLRQIQPRGESVKTRRSASPSDMGKRIRIAANVFREKIKPWSDDRRAAFTRFLLECVYIDLQEARDTRLARQMFVTGNMRGRTLNRVDLLKGQLTDIADSEQKADTIVRHWNGARNAMGDDFEKLLVAVDFIERQAPQGDDCLNALADHVATTRGPAGIEAWIQRLTLFAGDMLELNAHLTTAPQDAFSSNIWRLQLFRWDHWRPLALLWYADYRRAKKQAGPGAAKKIEAAQRRFAGLHKRCMGITICGFSAADREKIFGRAIAQASRGDNPLASTGALAFNAHQIARIAETLRLPMTDHEIRSTVLRWFESMHHADAVPAYVREATVEHILPRRPAVGSNWSTDFADSDDRYFACHTLGNLAALDRTRNEKLKNAEFADKIAVFKEASAEFHTLRDIPADEPWSAALITARTARLAAQIEAALDLPPAYIKT